MSPILTGTVGRYRRGRCTVALGICLFLLGCARQRTPTVDWRGFNIVWISFDSIRADHCSFNGYSRPTTPELARLAARGVSFRHCVAQAPYTLPSYASMLSSRHVSELAIRERSEHYNSGELRSPAPSLEPSDVLLSEVLRENGYHTAAFVQSWLGPGFGFDQGWDFFHYERLPLREKVPLALHWIDQQGTSPFFLFLYATEPHYPYLHGQEYDEVFGRFESQFVVDLETILGVREGRIHPKPTDLARAIGMYDEGLLKSDQALAPLINRLMSGPLGERTLVVFNSDHGQEFLEHGVLAHGQTYYEASIKVPLVISGPGIVSAGRTEVELTRNLDIATTVLDMLGIKAPSSMRGRSLAPLLLGRPPGLPAPPAVSEGAWTGWVGAYYEGDRKLLFASTNRRELYDWRRDPEESTDTYQSERRTAHQLERSLLAHFRSGKEALRARSISEVPYETWIDQVLRSQNLESDSELRDELRSLGYLH